MEVLKTALPYIISGISVGGQYALIAIGYTMVYGILRLINFAHGDVFMVAGLMMVYFATWMPLYLAIPLMIVLTVLLGFLIERVAYKPLRTAPRMSVMISAIGVSYLIQNLALYVTGGLNKNYPAIPWISDPVRLFGMETSRVTVITPFLTIALVIALVLLINHTKIGMAMRAVSVDFETAQLMGIKINNVISATFIIGTFLAAIGTVADVMQMSGENRTIVSRGLDGIEHSDFIGLHALLKEAGLTGKDVSSVQIGFVLAPRINAAGRMGAADMAAELLLCQDEAKAEELAKALCALNRERQNVEQDIYTQAEEMIGHMPDRQRSALVLESSRWHQGVVGIVASRLSEKYARPSFMIHLNGATGKGSCRSWGGFNLFAALESCKDLLLGFGGHELAAGFTIKEENIPAFRARMNEYARNFRGGAAPVSVLDVDVAITHPSAVTLEELSALEPYGSGNARPVFCLLGATLLRTQNVGQNRHLKLRLGKGSAQFDGIFFSTVAEDCGCKAGDRVDAAFYLQVNEFRGSRTLQLQMVDLRPSLCASGREQDSLTLADCCADCSPLAAKEARRLLPTRDQFAAAWRFLERTVPDGGLTTGYLPLLRQLAAELGRTEPFPRAAVCLSVFAERGLLTMERQEDDVTLRLHRGKKVALGQSPQLIMLQQVMEKGGIGQ